MTGAPLLGIGLIAAVVAGCCLLALRQERREARADEASRTAPRGAYGPLVRPVHPAPFPALRPPTAAEQAELARLDYWEHIMAAIGEPGCGSDRG